MVLVYSRSQPVVQFAVLWTLGVATLRPSTMRQTRKTAAVPYPVSVFLRELRGAAKGKARPSLHPFLVDHLKLLPEEHPTLRAYYELFIRCLESGRVPESWRRMICVLIPKTYGDRHLVSALRDIWLVRISVQLTTINLRPYELTPFRISPSPITHQPSP